MGGHLCLLSYAQGIRFETHLHIRRFVFACMGGSTLVLDRAMKKPYIDLDDYHAETDPERAPIGAWIVWGFLIAVAVFLAVAFWNVWGSQ